MPELPEVETIRKQLCPYLPFDILHELRSQWLGSILHTPEEFLQGDTITELHRHGKILIFRLLSGRSLIAQLGMSGRWRISSSPLEEKHLHLQLKGEGYFLSYIDPRRFGHLYIWNQCQWKNYLKRQGIDPTSDGFTADYFAGAIKRYPRRLLKATLLDQSIFSGIGNYMANEICAHANIRPTRRCLYLTRNELEQLFIATLEVARGALEFRRNNFSRGLSGCPWLRWWRIEKSPRLLPKDLSTMPDDTR